MTNHVENATCKKGVTTKTMALVGVMVALCCILAPVSIPIGPVPISLSLIAVYLSAYVLGALKGSLAVLVYILIGFAGLPVFSGYTGGAAKLFGPTGGFIASYVLMTLITGFFVEKFRNRKAFLQIVGMLLSLAVCYALGTSWFSMQLGKGIEESLKICVYPFVLIDIAKIAFCFILGDGVRKGLQEAAGFVN